MHLINTLCK